MHRLVKNRRAVVVVKWSAYSPSSLAIRVRILLESKLLSVNCLKRTKINEKEAANGPFEKTS